MRLIDQALIDSVSAAAALSPRKRKNFNFHQPDDALQRFLNGVEPGTYFCPHRHVRAGKTEILLVLRGLVGVMQFSDEGEVTAATLAKPGGSVYGVDLDPTDWHTLVVLEPGTVILECKAGPYEPGTAKDFAPWAPKEGTPAATALVKKWELLFPA